jgi:F0F1-type ATP synthase membrane subunit a
MHRAGRANPGALQAYVFTLLSAVYIQLSLVEEH